MTYAADKKVTFNFFNAMFSAAIRSGHRQRSAHAERDDHAVL